jgi:hypothetical protein
MFGGLRVPPCSPVDTKPTASFLHAPLSSLLNQQTSASKLKFMQQPNADFAFVAPLQPTKCKRLDGNYDSDTPATRMHATGFDHVHASTMGYYSDRASTFQDKPGKRKRAYNRFARSDNEDDDSTDNYYTTATATIGNWNNYNRRSTGSTASIANDSSSPTSSVSSTCTSPGGAAAADGNDELEAPPNSMLDFASAASSMSFNGTPSPAGLLFNRSNSPFDIPTRTNTIKLTDSALLEHDNNDTNNDDDDDNDNDENDDDDDDDDDDDSNQSEMDNSVEQQQQVAQDTGGTCRIC